MQLRKIELAPTVTISWTTNVNGTVLLKKNERMNHGFTI
jgi:hypothetical protein